MQCGDIRTPCHANGEGNPGTNVVTASKTLLDSGDVIFGSASCDLEGAGRV